MQRVAWRSKPIQPPSPIPISMLILLRARLWVALLFFFSIRIRHTRSDRDWSSDVCSSDLESVRHARCNTANQRTKLAALVAWGEGLAAWPDCHRTLEYLERLEFRSHGSDSFKEEAKQVKEQIEELRFATVTSLYEGERAMLLDVLENFERLYSARKRERNVLDFSDLEAYAVGLLQTEPAVRERTSQQFQQI